MEFYKKKVTTPLSIPSFGGTTRGGFNIISVGSRIKGGIGRDNAVNVDDMSWIWKSNHPYRPSYCRPASEGTDIFPSLITGGTLEKT